MSEDVLNITTTSPLIKISGLTKFYPGNKKVPALYDVNFTLEKGQICGLLGPNGSGKSTLIRSIMGLQTHHTGEIFVQGKPVGHESQAIISYLPDTCAYPLNESVKKMIKFYSAFYADFDAQKATKMLQDFDIDLNSRLKHLSKGNLEKVQIILTLCRNAQIYILDEPLSAVDPATRSVILNTILSNFGNDSLLIISTHIISEVEMLFDTCIFMEKGQVRLAGSADDIRAEYNSSLDAVFRKLYLPESMQWLQNDYQKRPVSQMPPLPTESPEAMTQDKNAISTEQSQNQEKEKEDSSHD